MKTLHTTALSLVTALSFTLALASPAHAQATRTWVSGTGSDANPCSRTAPCQTFAGAISKTAAGGEINCLDPGGFGTVSITKSMIIDCENIGGSVLASSTTGITVNDSTSGFPNTIRVILRGLSINGSGGGVQNGSGNLGTGLIGVNFLSGASLTIEDCIIENFNAGTAAGVRIAPAAAARVRILNSHIVNNSVSALGGGVFVQPGAAGSALIEIENTQITGNTHAAFRVDTAVGAGTGVIASISNSLLSGSNTGILINQPAGAAPVSVMVSDSVIANNTTTGISVSGANSRVRVGGSTIFDNGTAATTAGGAVVNTYENNQSDGNATSNGTFTPTPLS